MVKKTSTSNKTSGRVGGPGRPPKHFTSPVVQDFAKPGDRWNPNAASRAVAGNTDSAGADSNRSGPSSWGESDSDSGRPGSSNIPGPNAPYDQPSASDSIILSQYQLDARAQNIAASGDATRKMRIEALRTIGPLEDLTPQDKTRLVMALWPDLPKGKYQMGKKFDATLRDALDSYDGGLPLPDSPVPHEEEE